MKKRVTVIFYLLLWIVPALTMAQGMTEKPEMADGLFASGKIYVVVAVLLIILTGIFFYLVMLDRKISRLEKNSTKK